MRIGVLGPLSHDGACAFGRRDRAVLTALAMCVGRAVSADRLAEAVWGGDPPPTSHKAVQGCVVRLRKALGADAIETSARGYRLVVPADEVDSQCFERMAARSRELLAMGEPESAAYLLAQALDLWRGGAFEDVGSWDLAAIEAGRLEELRLEAEELRVDAALRTGRHLDVLAAAEGMVRAAPLRERRWTLLALAQYQSGRQTEALRTIHQLKSLLAEKLGLDPGPDLSSLEEAILRQDDSLLARGSTPTSPTCSDRGPAPYDVPLEGGAATRRRAFAEELARGPEVAAYPRLARLLGRGWHPQGTVSERGLRGVLPPRQVDLLIEAGVVDLLVGGADGTPGDLPMLCQALTREFARMREVLEAQLVTQRETNRLLWAIAAGESPHDVLR